MLHEILQKSLEKFDEKFVHLGKWERFEGEVSEIKSHLTSLYRNLLEGVIKDGVEFGREYAKKKKPEADTLDTYEDSVKVAAIGEFLNHLQSQLELLDK